MRLQAIKNIQNAAPPTPRRAETESFSPARRAAFPDEWEHVAPFVMKRDLTLHAPLLIPAPTYSLAVVASDLRDAALQGRAFRAEDFLFFDLETSGLSGGSGTVAFLAAFGRLDEENRAAPHGQEDAPYRAVRLTQYLLLDFPGEGDFLDAVTAEFGSCPSHADPLIMVSYNGKCFDSQILKSRCLMNGIAPPVFRHADLLHPARRLWKRNLSSCAQAEIETAVLGLDRSGDTPGAAAPDIWFSFLKTGELEPLLSICDHNKKDILGLSAIFAAFSNIASDPFAFADEYRVDRENLALLWRSFARHKDAVLCPETDSAAETARALLQEAAALGFPTAAFILGADCARAGNHEEARRRFTEVYTNPRAACTDTLKARALLRLASDVERRLKDSETALSFVEEALSLAALSPSLRTEIQRRHAGIIRRGLH